ncbi:hypothetical protein Tco_1560645, partial [Tanacetum coccineum]
LYFQAEKEAIFLILTGIGDEIYSTVDGPYMPTNVLIAAVEAAENILPVAAHEEIETIHNMTVENRLYFQAEKEAIFLILTGIGDEIYSTVDACNTSKEMWTAIERLQQGCYPKSLIHFTTLSYTNKQK